MTKSSMVAVLLGAFAASACSSASDTASGAPGARTPEGENVGQTTEALRAYLTSGGSSPIRIDQLELDMNADTKAALAGTGCDAFAKTGEGGLRFRARASYPDAFLDWASKQMAKAEGGARPRLQIAVANEKKEVKCRVEVEASSLEHLTLNGTGVQGEPIDDVRLAWSLKGGVSVAAGDVTGDGRDAPIGEGVSDVLANEDEPVTVGLLVPAVQKIREARIHGSEIRLFDATSVLPPPIEVDLDEATFAELFDGAGADEIELGLVSLAPSSASHGTGAGAGKVSVHDISFTTRLKKEPFAASRTKAKMIPTSRFGVVTPPTVEELEAARGKATILADELGPALDVDAVSRLLSALEDQPDGIDALRAHWRGDPAKGTAGATTSFDAGLGSFLKTASNVEGVWAYRRLPVAANVFSKLGSARGRALTGASLLASSDAVLPLRPGRLRTIGDAGGHDYRLARASVLELTTLNEQALAGVEPDEIDVANAAKAEAYPAVSSVDASARAFLLAREAVLDAPAADDAALKDLAAKSAVLAKDIDALRTVTKARFGPTN